MIQSMANNNGIVAPQQNEINVFMKFIKYTLPRADYESSRYVL